MYSKERASCRVAFDLSLCLPMLLLRVVQVKNLSLEIRLLSPYPPMALICSVSMHTVSGALGCPRVFGRTTQLSYPPMDLRSCNQSKTDCSLGLGVVDGTAKVISSSAAGAKVAINLNYKVGRSHSINANGYQSKQEIPSDVKALHANQIISKTIDVAYGEVLHMSLAYGVDVAVCAQKHYAGQLMPDRSVCKGY